VIETKDGLEKFDQVRIVCANFPRAWKKYKLTNEYIKDRDVLTLVYKIKQPYADNIIQAIFAAGFNLGLFGEL
jgi:hypothetical protein